jgi:hypothetical protein
LLPGALAALQQESLHEITNIPPATDVSFVRQMPLWLLLLLLLQVLSYFQLEGVALSGSTC